MMLRQNWKKRQSVLFTWLVSYILILAVPVLTTAIAYVLTAKVLEKEIINSNSFLIKRMQQQMDGLLDNAVRLCNAVSLDARVNELIKVRSAREVKQYDLYQLARSLQTYHVLNGSIDDFYVYFKSLDLVVSRDGSYDSQTFYELYFRNTGWSFAQWRRIIADYYKGDSMPFQYENNVGEMEKSIAFIRTIPLYTRGAAAANIIVNLNESRIMDDIRGIGALSGGTVAILDPDNRILAGLDHQKTVKGLNYRAFADTEGIQHQRVNGKRVVISHITSEKSEWKYLVLIPVSVFWEKADYVRNLSLLSLVLCLGIGGVIAGVALRRNYNPLELLIKSLEKYQGTNFDQQNNEYSFIHQAIDKAHTELEKVDSALRQQNKQLRSHFLSRLLQGKESGNELTRERLALYEIEFPSDSFAVMAFYVEDFHDAPANGNGSSETQTMENFKRVQALISQTVTELVSPVHQGYMVDVDDLLVCLVNLNPDHSGAAEELTQIAATARQQLEERLGIHLLVSASEIHQTLTGIPEAYNQALQAMEYKKVLGIEEIIDYGDLAELPTGSYYYPLEKEQQLINSIKAGDSDGSKRILEEIFARNFEGSILPLKIARCLMFNLVSTMIKTVNEVSQTGHDDFLEELNPVDRLLECGNINEMKQEIFAILDTFGSFLKAKHKEKSKLRAKADDALLKEKIVAFVEANYTDANLGITFIAEHFKINPIHLSRSFLEQTGEALLDFINKTRVNKAKELFDKMSNLDEVAQAVGYCSTRTFTRAFKKYEGVTPGKYREWKL